MNLYLIRHAHALSLEQQGVTDDADRKLSDKGESQSRQLARALQLRGVQLDAVVTSPLARARSTADLMIDQWQGDKPKLIVEEKICPGVAKPKKLARILRQLRCESVAVIAHEPDMSEWAAWFLGAKTPSFNFAKAGTAYIDWDSDLKKGDGILKWLTTPRWYETESNAIMQ